MLFGAGRCLSWNFVASFLLEMDCVATVVSIDSKCFLSSQSGDRRLTPLHVIPHVIDPAEDAFAPFPFALDARVVLRLVSRAVFLAAEAALRRLRARLVAAEEVLVVATEMLSQIARTRKDGAAGTAWVGASPCTRIVVEGAVGRQVWWVRCRGARGGRSFDTRGPSMGRRTRSHSHRGARRGAEVAVEVRVRGGGGQRRDAGREASQAD